MNKIVRRFIIRGRVQGVGFRWFVDREARQLGLHGWVRNNLDGSVEVLAAGTEAQIEALRARLREGSRGSRVDSVDETEVSQPAEQFTQFQIEGAW